MAKKCTSCWVDPSVRYPDEKRGTGKCPQCNGKPSPLKVCDTCEKADGASRKCVPSGAPRHLTLGRSLSITMAAASPASTVAVPHRDRYRCSGAPTASTVAAPTSLGHTRASSAVAPVTAITRTRPSR